jgi:hypothetical protein
MPMKTFFWGWGLLGPSGSGDLDGFTDVTPTAEVPCIRKPTALVGFHRLDGAISAIQKNTGFIGLVDEGESIAAGTQSRVTLDKIGFRESQKSRDGGNVGFREFNKPRPAATIRATLTGVAWGITHEVNRRGACRG